MAMPRSRWVRCASIPKLLSLEYLATLVEELGKGRSTFLFRTLLAFQSRNAAP